MTSSVAPAAQRPDQASFLLWVLVFVLSAAFGLASAWFPGDGSGMAEGPPGVLLLGAFGVTAGLINVVFFLMIPPWLIARGRGVPLTPRQFQIGYIGIWSILMGLMLLGTCSA